MFLISFTHLIELLEFHHLKENVLKDVLCISVILIQLCSHTKDISTLAHIKFQIIVCAWTYG